MKNQSYLHYPHTKCNWMGYVTPLGHFVHHKLRISEVCCLYNNLVEKIKGAITIIFRLFNFLLVSENYTFDWVFLKWFSIENFSKAICYHREKPFANLTQKKFFFLVEFQDAVRHFNSFEFELWISWMNLSLKSRLRTKVTHKKNSPVILKRSCTW